MNKLTASEIQTTHHHMLLDFRNQDRIVQSDLFKGAWTKATTVQRSEAFAYIKTVQPIELKNWATKIIIKTLDRLSMRILRQLASFHHIKNYSRISKSKLIAILNSKGIEDVSTNRIGVNKKFIERNGKDAINSTDS